jgi:hypothetical protein
LRYRSELIKIKKVSWTITPGLENMKIIGIDFTSSPSKSKPLTCAFCKFNGTVLSVNDLKEWSSFAQYEDFLISAGPWVAGIDFPFGLSSKFIRNMDWPRNWNEYVGLISKLKREEFRRILDEYRKCRPYGDKEHKRATDVAAGSISPQKIYGVPVGLMLYEGAPRLLRSGASIPGILEGDPKRLVFESYPGVLVRRLIGRTVYKQDYNCKQTVTQKNARSLILNKVLNGECAKDFNFMIELNVDINNDAKGDKLDSILSAIQAAWAWKQKGSSFGKPSSVDQIEGWIADPTTCRIMDDFEIEC